MFRVLVGGFGPVARLGIREILEAPDLVIVGECRVDAVMDAVAPTSPDVLLLDSGPAGDSALSALVVSTHPEITVVALSTECTSMRIYPRFGGGRSFSQPLSAAALVDSVRG